MLQSFLAFIKPHVWYWVLIAGGILAFHSWLREHDARLLAYDALKQSESKVAELQAERTQRDQQADQQKEVIIREVQQAKTPQQQIDLIPKLADTQLNPIAVPASPDAPDAPSKVQVDLQPLISELSSCKQNSIELGACQADLRGADAIALEKDNEIKTLKKKPGFWHSFGRDLKMISCAAGGGAIGAQFGRNGATGAGIGAAGGAALCSLF